jgi:hypothetical protein
VSCSRKSHEPKRARGFRAKMPDLGGNEMDKASFRVGCDLRYVVDGFSSFIFNVGVVRNSFQRVRSERFITDPSLQVQESLSPVEEKRHHRFSSRPGPVRVAYEAEVELTHAIKNGSDVPESSPGTIPSEDRSLSLSKPLLRVGQTSAASAPRIWTTAAGLLAGNRHLQLDS